MRNFPEIEQLHGIDITVRINSSMKDGIAICAIALVMEVIYKEDTEQIQTHSQFYSRGRECVQRAAGVCLADSLIVRNDKNMVIDYVSEPAAMIQ